MAPAVVDEITCTLTSKRISQEINADLLQLCPKAHGLVLKDPTPKSITEDPISQDFIPQAPITHDPSSPFLQISPYTAPLHLLPLSTLSPTHQLLALALTHFVPLTPRYATIPYHLAFNWAHVLSHLPPSFPASSYYCIVFRSRIAPNTSRAHLGELDAEAHREAVASGGLLKYWFGTPDVEGRNLATCVWRDRGDARKGGAGKGHAKAMGAARGAYVEWEVERLRLVIGEGGREWNIEEWVE